MKVGDVYFIVYGANVVSNYPDVIWEKLAQFLSWQALQDALADESRFPKVRDYRVVRCEVIQ